jgi:hypothetical protein
MPGASTKIPHLIVVADGTDLGPITGNDTTWSDANGVEIAWTRPAQIFWEKVDCTGIGMVGANSLHQSARLIAPFHKTLIQITSQQMTLPLSAAQETVDNSGKANCAPTPNDTNVTGNVITDMKIAASAARRARVRYPGVHEGDRCSGGPGAGGVRRRQ